MNGVTGLVDGSLTPGVYRVLGEPTAIVTELAAAGWHPAILPPTETRHDFYTEIAAALGFGDYFGRNLDALWDCLSDLDQPTALVMADWNRFARARPHRWRPILDVLVERAEQPPPFAVLLV